MANVAFGERIGDTISVRINGKYRGHVTVERRPADLDESMRPRFRFPNIGPNAEASWFDTWEPNASLCEALEHRLQPYDWMDKRRQPLLATEAEALIRKLANDIYGATP